ncbi:MAG TPA: M6 family metalloprotease domain-containing protein, partial [Allosphingosinicella sp.]|nr:M6 family metalloprotease domain-containing protein [Allosphingosinicella sp.]
MSMPFINEEFTFTQPDGSLLRVRGTGNQYSARFETLDGFTVVKDPVSGFYHYARPSEQDGGLAPSGVRVGAADPRRLDLAEGLRASRESTRFAAERSGLSRGSSRWQRRRAERRDALRLAAASEGIRAAPPRRRTVGTYVGLTLLIDFDDQPGTIPREEVEAFCNQQGYSGYGNHGSVRDYFHDISGGALEYTNIVMPYYRARQRRDYYTKKEVPQPERAVELIREALASLVAGGFQPDGLTSDEEDFVYALNVFYAGTRVNNHKEGLWPHEYHLPTPFELGPGKKIHDYQITDMTDELSLGTFCHENGHLICDFPDLYDEGGQSNGAGMFCLMGSGGSGDRRKNPAQVGAYLKQAAGWASQTVMLQPGLPGGQQVTLRAARNEFAVHRRNDTEYYVIENRVSGGRDATLGANGLAIWHVDETGSNEHELGLPGRHYECALVQADGLMELEAGGSEQGDDNDLFKAGHKDVFGNATHPRSCWWDRSDSGL